MATNLLNNLEDEESLNILKTNQAPLESAPVDKSTVDPELTVEKQMQGLLSSDSPYLQAARTRGLQFANQRGLLNTSIAAGASEKSAIESALPIAQQDAQYLQTGALTTQKGRIQEGLYHTQGDISKDIATHEGGIASNLSAQEATQAQTLEGIAQEGENYRQQVELEMKDTLATMEIGSKERQSYANSVTEMGDNFMVELNNIQRDPNITGGAKTNAIATLQTAYRQNVETLASIYGVTITWGEDLITSKPLVPPEPPEPPRPPETPGYYNFM